VVSSSLQDPGGNIWKIAGKPWVISRGAEHTSSAPLPPSHTKAGRADRPRLTQAGIRMSFRRELVLAKRRPLPNGEAGSTCTRASALEQA